jgi:membrane-associated phospholipid phosphatase
MYKIKLMLRINIFVALVILIPSKSAFAAGAVETTGEILQYALPVAAAGLTLGHKDKEGAIQLGESLLLSTGVTYALKYGLDTTRPNGGHHSMPSGHSSISFSSAEFIRKRYGWEYGVPAYALASFVAYSRVESRDHHPEDVVVGAAIGILSSYLFTKPYNGWKIEADAGEKYYGIRLSRSW